MEWVEVIRKVQKDNASGAVKTNIPAEYAAELGLVPGTYINFEKAGNTLHLTRVVLEGVLSLLKKLKDSI